MLRAPTTPTGKLAFRRFFASVATVQKADVPAAGGRFVVEEDAEGNALLDPILVVPVNNSWYAIDATCPHMNKDMSKGKVVVEDNPDEPLFQCPLHNTRFSLKTGVCKQWVTGALGYDNKIVSGLAQKVGGEKRDIKAYRVIENEDGTLTIEDGASEE